MRTTERWICAVVICLAGSGFAWPGRGERIVTELTSASTQRAKRDALRLLRSALSQGTWQPPAQWSVVEQLRNDRDVDVRVDALGLLAALERSSAPWLEALHDAAPSVRVAAIQALGELEQPLEPNTLEAVLRASGDVDAQVRLASVRALASVRSPRALTALTLTLRDSAIDVRVAAARALGSREPLEPEAVALLLSQVDDGFPEQRAAAIDALARSAQPASQAALRNALYDSDSAVVLAALRGFARQPGLLLTERVSSLAVDASASAMVRAAATTLLQRRAELASRAAPHAGELVWLAPLEQTALPTLRATDSAAVLVQLERVLPRGASLATDPLVEWLGHAPPALRIRIAALIEQSGGPVSGAAIAGLLNDPDATRRAAYVRLLARADAHYEPVVLARLQDGSEDVRSAALHVLSNSVQSATWSALATSLRQARGTARRELLRIFALAVARPVQKAALIAATKREPLTAGLLADVTSQDDVAAALALRVLAELGDPAARAAVLEALRTPGPARAGRVIAALRASIADASVEAQNLRRALSEHADPRIAATAIVALALADDPLPLPWLAAQLGSAAWPIGPAAAFALAEGMARRSAGTAELAWCPMLSQREPITRQNLAWAIVRRERDPCRAEASALLTREFARDVAGIEDLSAAVATAPRAVVLQDARLIVSWPDASGQIDWPRISAVGHVNAWLRPYAAP